MLLLLGCFSCVWLCATPETAAHQAPPSLAFSRQEHWSGLPFPSPMHESEKWKWSRSVMYNSQWPRGLQPTRLLHPWIVQARVLEWGAIAFSRWPCYFILIVGELAARTVRGGFGSSCLMFGIMGVGLLPATVRAVLEEYFWNLCSLLRSRGGGKGGGEREVANRGGKGKGSRDWTRENRVCLIHL